MIEIKRAAPAFERSGRTRQRRVFLRPLIDATAFFVAFLLITALSSVPLSAMPTVVTEALTEQVHSLAVAADQPPPVVEIAATSSVRAPNAVLSQTSTGTAWILLGLALSALAALNLAIVRHLRLSYRPVRRRRTSP